MENKLDIVKLFEKNPIVRFTGTYQNKFIEKIKNSFTETQQNLFIGSFYCYLNRDSKIDFVIELDSVWKWLGFSRKDHCKVVLEKHFTMDIDYKVSLEVIASATSEARSGSHGGSNKISYSPEVAGKLGRPKEKILLNVNTFKKLCLKSNTKKADEIHDYFIKLEELFQEVVNEESNELKNQLQEKETLLVEKNKELVDKDYQQKIDRHKFLIEKFKNKKCVYILEIENDSSLVKIGSSGDINSRITGLYGKCIFLDIYECDNFREVEKSILHDVNEYLYKGKISDHVSREVVQISEKFKYNQLISIVKFYVAQINFLKPDDLLYKQELENESERLGLIKYLLISCLILLGPRCECC